MEAEKDPKSFWIETQTDEGETVKLCLDVRVMPKKFAEEAKVGTAREEPNFDPFLMPPVGRIKFTTDPCKMID